MTVTENEQLFLNLTVFDNLTDTRIDELKGAGYLDKDCENTEKAETFIKNFVAERSDEVVRTLDEQGSYLKDKGHVMYHSGIKSLMAMEVIMELLASQMVIKKKRNGDYIKRNGFNTP